MFDISHITVVLGHGQSYRLTSKDLRQYDKFILEKSFHMSPS